MKLDLSKIKSAIEKETCRLPALPPSAQAFLGCHLSQPQLWIANSFQGLEKLADSFRTFSKHWKKQVLLFQGLENNDMEVIGESLKTLQFLQSNPPEPFVIITLFQCLGKKVPRFGNPQVLKVGDTIDPDKLFQGLEKQKGGGSASFQGLEKMGYTLDVEVYEKGVAARRGGIIDLWPPTEEHPVRIEFFGNEIEKFFNTANPQ